MNARERFLAIAHFERPNDPFLFGLPAWNATYRRWVREGMPVPARKKAINAYLLGFQDEREGIRPNAAVLGLGENGNPPWVPPLVPFFQQQVLHEDEQHITRIEYDGAVVRVMKDDPEAMAQWLSYPVTDRKSWEAYKKRLDPASPERFPAGWDRISDDKLSWPVRPEIDGQPYAARDFPLGMTCLTLFGGPRNYMGLENLSYALYDDPCLVEDMIAWQAWFACELIDKVFAAGVTLDWAWIWEDMAYNNGPLVAPSFVRTHMAPHYRMVVDLLRSHGVDVIILDSDGDIHDLIPIWLDCGINGFYPLEVASHMDGIALRKQYGRDILLTGNVDKRLLAGTRSDIDGELARVKVMLAEGGFFPGCDHHVPPDVPYENIVYFLNELRQMSDYEETRRFIPPPVKAAF